MKSIFAKTQQTKNQTMGTDSHVYVEKFNKETNKWKAIKKYKELWCSERNYDLFSILANVRNGYGFAWTKTSDGFVPISLPKGIPDDVSAFVQSEITNWGENGHTHSYLSLKEMKEFDWNQTTRKQGFVDAREYNSFKQNGIPDCWWGDVFGGNTTKLTNEQMDHRINDGTVDGDCYTMVSWEVCYSEIAKGFLNEDMPYFESLSEDGSGEDVRIVFFFDS
jgi:hypothetical protein